MGKRHLCLDLLSCCDRHTEQHLQNSVHREILPCQIQSIFYLCENLIFSYDLRFQTIHLDERMEKLGIRHVIRSFGEKHPDSGHVFHINLKNPEGVQCNEEECAWFRQYE